MTCGPAYRVFGERVGEVVGTGHVVGFNAGLGTIDEQVHDGGGIFAVALEDHTEVIEERAVDHERVAGHQNRQASTIWTRFVQDHELRRGVRSDDPRRASDASGNLRGCRLDRRRRSQAR